MDLAFNGKSTNIREAIVKFNHDDDSYEVVAHGATPDMLSAIEENIKQDLENHPEREVIKVERILGQREHERDENAERFLSDLQNKKQQIILHKILNTKEGPQILHTQKQKLIETLQSNHHPYKLQPKAKLYPDNLEDVMSVDEASSVRSDAAGLNTIIKHQQLHYQQQPIDVRQKDLHQKDNYLFFELFTMYAKQQLKKQDKK